MRPLAAEELLNVWEEGATLSLLEKMLLLLSKACNEDREEIGRLSIGERDARLLQLREWMFGSIVKNMSACTHCNETVEWETDTAILHLQPINTINKEPFIETFHLQQEGFNIKYRLPNSYDISNFLEEENNVTDPYKLLAKCIVEIAGINGEKYSPEQLPETAWQAMDKMISEEDPQADINMQIVCPHCHHRWEAIFDIMSFLWAEINSWAKSIMQEVALLARAFSWAEKDILNMSARRRRMYLEMLYP